MPKNTISPQIPPLGPRDHSRGPDSAAVTLLEYGDFECPQCGHAYPMIKELHDFFGDRLRVVFRNFPLTNVHPHAQRAAEAAEWAASLNAFWPLHDALFQSQAKLSDSHILSIATTLGLPAASLAEAWNAHTFFPRVKEDFLGGVRGGVKGTPSFFINNVKVEGPWDAAILTRAIHQAITLGADARVSDPAAGLPDPALLARDVEPPR